ncbi:uncharacterized protein [Dysidea avara]|uniref:uncharacterized protein n=1 Tax=Dysidea avara TaxID=196820 RepID=UPI00332EC166
MKQFAEAYGFDHVTTSPYYPQANGQAERTVRTIKSLLTNAKDPYMALLSYHATPLQWCNLSPAELLQGRQIRTDLPQPKPQWNHTQHLNELHSKYKSDQSKYYNNRHRIKSLPQLPDDTPVWVQTENSQVHGTIVHQAATPRSYIVSTPSGQLRRNRINLRPRLGRKMVEGMNRIPETSVQEPANRVEESQDRVVARSQSGVMIRAPDRLRF